MWWHAVRIDTVSRICQNPKFPSPQEGTVVATGNRQLNKENMPILGVYLLHCFSFCSPCNAILALYFQAVAVLRLILKYWTLILRANKTGGNKTSPNWDSKPSMHRFFQAAVWDTSKISPRYRRIQFMRHWSQHLLVDKRQNENVDLDRTGALNENPGGPLVPWTWQ